MHTPSGLRFVSVTAFALVVAVLAAMLAFVPIASAAPRVPAVATSAPVPTVEDLMSQQDRVVQPHRVTSVVPARLLDTRAGSETIDGRFAAVGQLEKKRKLKVRVTGRAGVPDDATAVLVNVTAVDPGGNGTINVFPCGVKRPRTQSVVYRRDQAVSAAVLAKVGKSGQVCVYSTKATDLVVDVNGYLSAEADTTAIVPSRLADTRSGRNRKTVDGEFRGAGSLKPKSTMAITIAGRGGIPADASAAVLNVTAVKPSARGAITVFPCGEKRPKLANISYRKSAISNMALAQIGTGGQVCIYSTKAVDVVVDATGFVGEGIGTTPLVGERLVDTRNGGKRFTVDGDYKGSGKLTSGSGTAVGVAGRGSVPQKGVGAVMLNITAISPGGSGHVTVFPCGTDTPNAASLNFRRKRTISNAVMAQVGEGGDVCIATDASTHLVVDVHGWFDLPPNQVESDVVVLKDEAVTFESISGGDDDSIGSFGETPDDPEVVRITTDTDVLTEGDTVVLSKPSGEPYYGEVTEVDGESVIAEEVSLAEVLPTMDVSIESDVAGNVTEIVGGDAISNLQVDPGITNAKENRKTDYSCTSGAEVDFSAIATADVGRFVFDVSFNIFEGLTDARIGFNPTIAAEVSATARAKATCKMERELFTKKLPTIKFLVGPIPVWITHELKVGIEAEVTAEAAGTVSLAGSASAFAGIVYENGQWDRRTTITPTFTQEITQNVEISATISVPVITYSARAYGIAGFDASVAANLKLTYRPLEKKVLTLTTYVDLRIALVVRLDLKVTELHWEFNFPNITLWGPLELWSHYQAATNCDLSTIPEAQCEALVQLWDEAGGRSWSGAPTWVSNNDPCGWEGVTCAGGNVVALDLKKKGVVGPLPTAIGGLTALERLDFNSEDGGFPQNRIESIPATIGELDALQFLDLSRTDLTALPPEIGDLNQLRTLGLTRNPMTSLPDTIGDLRRLERLLLDETPIVSLPREVGQLSNLEQLYMRDGGALTNLPTELSNLGSLRDLHVSGNPISAVPYLGNSPDLWSLNVSDTAITQLPGGLENATGLSVLHASNVAITTLPIGIGGSPDLFQLYLLDTAVEGDITATVRRLFENDSNGGLEIRFSSSACPVVEDSALRTWLTEKVDVSVSGSSWDANCPDRTNSASLDG